MSDAQTTRVGRPGRRGSHGFARGRAGASERRQPVVIGYYQVFTVEWWLLVLAALALMFVNRGADVSVLIYLGCCAGIIGRDVRSAGTTLIRYAPILILPSFTIFSAIWSEAPGVSLKQGLELLATIATALVVCRRFTAVGLAGALMISGFVTCLVCLLVQRSAFQGVPLNGFMDSKNQVAFVAQILLASSTAVFLDVKLARTFRFLAPVAGCLAIVDIALAQSAGGLVTSVVSMASFLALLSFTRLAMGYRVLLVLCLSIALIPLIFVYQDVIALVQTLQANVLHKDATLTGRTGLWTFARSLIAEQPILGHGFAAFWREGNLDAEGLWRAYGIGSRSGFNFHNQFDDTLVDLGAVGLCVLVVTLVCLGAGSIWRAVSRPSLGAAFMASLLVALYSRLPVESILVGSWNVFTFLWMATAVQAFAPAESLDPITATSKRGLASRRRPAHRVPIRSAGKRVTSAPSGRGR